MRRLTALLASTVGVLALAIPAQATGSHPATIKPSLTSAMPSMQRGVYNLIFGRNLQPSTSYLLSADYGRFGVGGRTETESTDTVGGFRTNNYFLTGDVTTSSVTLSLTVPATGDLIASLSIQVAPPSGRFGSRVCPGSLQALDGIGYLDGNYHLSSSTGTFVTSETTASNGRLDPIPQLRLPAIPPRQFTITVTRDDSGAVVLTDAETLTAPQVRVSYQNPWQRLITANCFAPYEPVQVVPASNVSVPASVTASVWGMITMPVALHPTSQPPVPATSYGQLTGTQTGQSADAADPANASVPGTTLEAGQSLTDANPVSLSPTTPAQRELATPTIGCTFEVIGGTGYVSNWAPDGKEIIWWSTDRSYRYEEGSTLKLLADGNLVMSRPNGQLRWQTSTAGTGSANRLVIQPDCNLVLSTHAGALVWSKDTGRVRNAQGLVSFAYLASTRSRSAVYVNGLVHQKSGTGQLIDSAGRTVYLQRYLNGHWQNVLARTTGGKGQLSVGFIQSTVYQYRLLVLPTPGTAGTASASTFR